MSKQRVLVIDDEQVVLDSVRKILMAENYEVDQCLGGKEGIEKAISQAYDLVLTDIRMPDIGGLIVLRDVKRAKPSLPVMIITGYASVRSAVQAMKLGAADYIEKPFSPDELVKAVSGSIHRAAEEQPEEQAIIHKEEVLKVLELGAVDFDFRRELLNNGADALDGFQLTGPEKLAIITGDIAWIEAHVGALSPDQKVWLEARLGAEIW
ncbi:MAG: response regulator [Thermodesulfobacteriota bacterium]